MKSELYNFKNMENKTFTSEEEEAALKIQAGARGYAARKEVAQIQKERTQKEFVEKPTMPREDSKRRHKKQDSEDYDSGTSMSSQNSIIRLEKSNSPIPVVDGVISVSSAADGAKGNLVSDNMEANNDAENSGEDSMRSTMETSDYVTSSSDNSESAPIRAKKTPFSLLKRFVNLISATNVRKHKVGVGGENGTLVKYSKSTNDLSSKENVQENGLGSSGEESSRSTGSKSKKLSKRLSKSRNSVASEPSSIASNPSKSSVRSSKITKSSKISPSAPEVPTSTA